MNKRYTYVFLMLFLAACSSGKTGDNNVVIETGYGDIEVELYPDKAPLTVAAFLKYVDEGLYKKASFYRVLKNDNVPSEYNTGLIQGGISNTAPAKQAALAGTAHESPRVTGLTHESGVISMARTTPGSATSEFFICIGDQKQFDSTRRGGADGQGYAAFGKVTKGMDVVKKIQNAKSEGDKFLSEIAIDNIIRD